MKITHTNLVNLVLTTVLLSSLFFIAVTAQISSYDPWYDFDDDGDIDIYDIVDIAGRYGTSGEPFVGKASVGYDSGWVNITDKNGQYFNITHNLNSTELIVDITGETANGEIHQRYLGGTGFLPKNIEPTGAMVTTTLLPVSFRPQMEDTQ